MREQIKEMELELLQYHKSNAALDLMIGELRLKKEGMQKEASELEGKANEGDLMLARVQADLQDTVAKVDDPKALKSSVSELYRRHVHGVGLKSGESVAASSASESDRQKEFSRQREYLEKNLEGLKRKLMKDMKMYRTDRSRLLRENTTLTGEINALRRELRGLQQETTCTDLGLAPPAARPALPIGTRTMSLGGIVSRPPSDRALTGTSRELTVSGRPSGRPGSGRSRRLLGAGATAASTDLVPVAAPEARVREAEIQRATVLQLRERLAKLRDVVSADPGLGRSFAEGEVSAAMRRPESRGSLPPLDASGTM